MSANITLKLHIHQPIISWLWVKRFYKNQQKHSDNYMEVTVATIAYFIIICKLCATHSLSVKFIINIYMCTHIFSPKVHLPVHESFCATEGYYNNTNNNQNVLNTSDRLYRSHLTEFSQMVLYCQRQGNNEEGKFGHLQLKQKRGQLLATFQGQGAWQTLAYKLFTSTLW